MPRPISRRKFIGRLVKCATGVGVAGAVGKVIISENAKDAYFRQRLPIKTAPAPKFTAQKAIESYPEIASKEMLFVKQKGRLGEIKEASRLRGEASVTYIGGVPAVRSSIHNHPVLSPEQVREEVENTYDTRGVRKDYRRLLDTNELNLYSKATFYPSPVDLSKIIMQPNSDKYIGNTLHIACMNRKGNLMRYITFRLKKNALASPKLWEYKWLLNELDLGATFSVHHKDQIPLIKTYFEVLEKLRKDGFLQIKLIPTKGYKTKEGVFVQN